MILLHFVVINLRISFTTQVNVAPFGTFVEFRPLYLIQNRLQFGIRINSILCDLPDTRLLILMR